MVNSPEHTGCRGRGWCPPALRSLCQLFYAVHCYVGFQGFYLPPQTQLPSGQRKWVGILTKPRSVLGRQVSGASCRCPEVPSPPPPGDTTWSKLSLLSLHFLLSQLQIILRHMSLWRFDMDVVLKTAWSQTPSPLHLPRPAPAVRLPGHPQAVPLPLLAVASAPHWGPGAGGGVRVSQQHANQLCWSPGTFGFLRASQGVPSMG